MKSQNSARVTHEISGQICTITIDNPPVNSLNKTIRKGLIETLDFLKPLAEKADVRVIILTGAGDKAFCAGADIREEAELTEDNAMLFRAEMDRLFESLYDFPVPIIGAINGYALGGGFSLAMSCDIRIAADNAKFGAVAANIGLTAASLQLVRAIGPARAKEMAFTAYHIPAEKAERWGLCNRVVSREELLPTCYELAERIATRAPLSIRHIKLEMNRAFDHSMEEGAAFARKHWYKLRSSRDHQEAIAAFLEKRQPNFTGN